MQHKHSKQQQMLQTAKTKTSTINNHRGLKTVFYHRQILLQNTTHCWFTIEKICKPNLKVQQNLSPTEFQFKPNRTKAHTCLKYIYHNLHHWPKRCVYFLQITKMDYLVHKSNKIWKKNEIIIMFSCNQKKVAS